MKERSIVWVFLAFVLGFMLPVGSCVGTGLVTLGALRLMGGEQAQPATPNLGAAVGVIRLEGTILSDVGLYTAESIITPQSVNRLLEQAESRSDIKAVVVYVNSPGGSVVASDEIFHALRDFEKPVVIWMGELAASGGYYIACGGDYVFAHPHTLTGSIGVISQFINAEEFLNELGVEATVITSGPYKDIGSLFREMTEEEQQIWATITDETYEGFIEVVSEARDIPLDEVRELADGRIYTGQQAHELGLVDEVDLLQAAIDKAAALGEIEGEPRVVELQGEPDWLGLFSSLQSRATLPTLDQILRWGTAPSLQFRVMYP
jgi:protease-4